MQLFLGDRVTLVNAQTFVNGVCKGIVLNDDKSLHRLYIEGMDQAFWMSDGWKVVEEEEEEA